MKIETHTYAVALAGEDEAREVTVIYGDMLRGELEGGRLHLPPIKEAPMHYTALWVWAALVRTGAYDRDFRTFQGEVQMIEAAKDPEPVPPTRG